MADYDRRLQRLEEHAAASANEREDVLLELCRERTAELLASKEMQAWMRENPELDTSAAEWAAEWAAWQAKHADELAKERQILASLALGQSKT